MNRIRITLPAMLACLYLCSACSESLDANVDKVWTSLSDDFSGNGPLAGYVVNNARALPDVGRVDGRYHARVNNNDSNRTLHYHNDQGRLDARAVRFPFEVVARNIGIGTVSDSQRPPSAHRHPYLFAGIQVHVPNLDSRNSSHVVVGHRGETPFTVEAKNTVNGHSSVNDAGANIVPDGRADIRIVGHDDRSLSVYWQRPVVGDAEDRWIPYNGTGRIPGKSPDYPEVVYVGLITYAYELAGLPFVGTCDAIEGGHTGPER